MRAGFVGAALAAGLAVIVAGGGRAPAARRPAPRLLDLRVSNGDSRFAGDRRLLATVTPNGDDFRDEAIVRFRLDRAATVALDAVRTDTIRTYRPAETAIWHTEARLRAGPGRLVWRPGSTTPPRTYVLRLSVTDSAGRTRVYGRYTPGQRQNAPVVRVQGVDVGFTQRSYAPGDVAAFTLATDARTVRLQVFDYGTHASPPASGLDPLTSGTPVTTALELDWRAHGDAPRTVRFVRAGKSWPSGLYFLRATADDGRVGYAPFVVRPRRLGEHRVAVVLSTNTWQAYNFRDADGDGWGDSWYVSSRIRHVDLRRPYLDFGVPFRFKDWDLEFLAWLNRTRKAVDYLTDDDLEDAPAEELAGAYDLVVFPGHAEYVTRHAYDALTAYRDRGGNLLFLSANNVFWSVRRSRDRLVRGKEWRALGLPEAGLVGAQYVGSDGGRRQAPYVVTGAADEPWVFAGTGLTNGSAFGRYGVEIDARTDASPPGTVPLARIPSLFPSGASAEMTYYETPGGAKVFAAGALNFAASIGDPVVSRLVENVWARLSRP